MIMQCADDKTFPLLWPFHEKGCLFLAPILARIFVIIRLVIMFLLTCINNIHFLALYLSLGS